MYALRWDLHHKIRQFDGIEKLQIFNAFLLSLFSTCQPDELEKNR